MVTNYSKRLDRARPRALAVSASLAVMAMLLPGVALADSQDPLDGKYLTGGWGGYRQKMIDSGVNLRGDMSTETMGVVSGGIRNGFRYSQQIRAGADFDLAKLTNLMDDGRIHLNFNDRRGRGTSQELAGNRFYIQENYGGEYTRLNEFSFDQNLFDNKANYKVGFFAMGNDFGLTPLLTNFVNAAFCAHPLEMSADSGWFNYPNANWGGDVTYHVTPDVYLRTGAFNVNPNLYTKHNSFDPFDEGSTGTIIPVEAAYEPNANGAYPGHYKVGYYHDNSDTAEVGNSKTRAGFRQGAYILLDQKITAEQADPSRGLSVFTQFMHSDHQTATINNWFSVGVVYTGPFDFRPKDTVAFGMVQARVNKAAYAAAIAKNPAYALSDQLGERAYELSYGIQLTPYASVRPDVQYIQNPGAFAFKDYHDAVVVGIQTKVTF